MSGAREEKVNVDDIYEILNQQKKLEEMKKIISGTLDKIDRAINFITVSCDPAKKFHVS